jgi:putative heme-binding domain-containing protein
MKRTATLRRGHRVPSGFVFLQLLLTTPALLHAADPFAEGVRPTPWQSPADQQKSFKVPPGFEIQLVAAEPQINKPMNLAFDAKGRLWVTTSIEYPWAAPTNKPGRDRLMIFEDFGPDGRARKTTEFAGGLNIPIGIYPFLSPASAVPDTGAAKAETWKAIVWSIPHIWLMEDTDGDGKADKREVLYGPFDYTRDTHGNQASFRRGFDGWLYATHGYNNDSYVKGRDGNTVHLNSGNTYRFRLDGSRIEHYTHGQVNPYGLAFDEFGNLYSSDCHSEPLYQLLAGGYYPSFGKPHDGLGFAPNMMERMRGSTAIDGVSIYADNLWPEEFHGNTFFGDVMASRVFRDRLTDHGSTRIARALPDLVVTDDPWFRPVDTCLGPDGALYIADFYNRIIGHYEVPLTHPGRDRESGRIWRVTYKEKPLRQGTLPDDLKGLVKELASPNLTRRMLAMNSIADRLGKQSVKEVETAATGPDNPQQEAHALWLLHRLEASQPNALVQAARSEDRLVRVHSRRIAKSIFYRDSLGSLDQGETDIHHIAAAHEIAIHGLKDRDALVQRCAAEAIALHHVADSSRIVRQLLDLRSRAATNDTHLLYIVRKAIRDQLRVRGVFDKVLAENLSDQDAQTLREVSLGVANGAAATFLLRQLPELSRMKNPSPPIADILKYAARYAPEAEFGNLASYAQKRIPDGFSAEVMFELGRQFALFKSVDEGLQQRGLALPAAVRDWGTNLVWRFFGSLDGYHSWTALPVEDAPTAIPWDAEKRKCADGKARELTSSLPRGEALTGVLRSKDFVLPARLSFWLCGHNGFPDKPDHRRNVIRLRENDSNAVLAETFPPRNDTAQRITWNLSAQQGKRAYVEVTDADTGGAYAWLAFGGFEPELSQLRASEFQPARMNQWLTAAAEAAVRTQSRDIAPVFARSCVPRRGMRLTDADPDVVATFARAWLALEPTEALKNISAALLADQYVPLQRERIAELLVAQNSPVAQQAVVAALKSSPLKTQEKLAYAMASSQFSAETLLIAIESGVVSPRVLQRVGVNNRLKSSKPTDWEPRVAKLTKSLTPANEQLERLVEQRRKSYDPAKAKAADGAALYVTSCAVCHSIRGKGGNIGPQLDGIGQRGLERLCEDILDPNRNVDGAFRTTLLVLKDGDVTSGLFRREEGELVVLAESTGKEISVAKKDVADRRQSDTSLMPENFGELLSAEDFNHLMAYLLSIRAQP